MSTEAQKAANKQNAQHSTGPTSEQGKANSSQNNHRHGFTGQFSLLPHESEIEYQLLRRNLMRDHEPTGFTEELLIEKMAQHHWLAQRAIYFQCATFQLKPDKERSIALYLRYQTANERGFSKCLSDLLKIRAEKRKAEIGFESQKLKQQEQARKQSIENRKQDLHKMDVWLAEAKAEHQELLNHRLETPELRNPNRVQRILSRTQAA